MSNKAWRLFFGLAQRDGDEGVRGLAPTQQTKKRKSKQTINIINLTVFIVININF